MAMVVAGDAAIDAAYAAAYCALDTAPPAGEA